METLNELGWSWERIIKEVAHFEDINDLREWKANFGASDFESVTGNKD